MLYHCHKLVHLCIAQHQYITIERGKVGPPLDDCGVHPTQESVHRVHSPQVCVPTFDTVIIIIYNIVFLQLDILNGGFFKNKEKFCPPNGRGVVFANKLQNMTSIPALHALRLEVDTLFRDAEEPIVFLVPMSTKISAEDLALYFILHAPYPDFYFIVGCHPRHWVPFQRCGCGLFNVGSHVTLSPHLVKFMKRCGSWSRGTFHSLNSNPIGISA
jgi:hypothetical protein